MEICPRYADENQSLNQQMVHTPDIEILLLNLYSILAREINSGAKNSIHSSNKTSRYKSKPHSVALLVMTCWCKDWCAICAVIVDIAYAYWNKESHVKNHAYLCNWPRWKDSARTRHRDDSKPKTFFASGSLTDIVPCFPLPHRYIP